MAPALTYAQCERNTARESGRRIYLMARYSRHPEMQQVTSQLTALGYTVTSRWIWGVHQASDEAIGTGTLGAFERRLALEDITDLEAADCCIGFSEPLRTPSRGGRMVELGLAIAWGKEIIVVGGHEHVFHCLPHITHVHDADALYHLLTSKSSTLGTEGGH